jgi:NAD(P) transhydrogenase subunit beta
MLSSPDTARRGNLLAAGGMGLAILTTIFLHRDADGQPTGNLLWIFGAMAIGTVIGYLMAVKVKMTAMPQMVSFFNGMGGLCAAVISLVEFGHTAGHDAGHLTVIFLGLVIGSISFSGSMVAYGKLDEKIKDINSKILSYLNILLLLVLAALIIVGVINPELLGDKIIWILLALSLIHGVVFVMPIGGADMPVVISLLNSFTGMAAAFGGFLYDNAVMLTGGILVGSAGTILTILMCKAMNRSLLNVIIGGFGSAGAAGPKAAGDKTIKEVSHTDAAIQLYYSKSVMIVPGYGLAVAQAQKVCKELDDLLEANGVDVKYGVHPVAGRMPGHMNVLLAEADVPYPKLVDLEEANDFLKNCDVAIIVGANDVVNPAALDDPSSPIYGMPVLEVWNAKNVIVMKRSMRSGYAGIDNPLFYHQRSRMLFGDAKATLQKLVSEVKAL